MLYVFPCFRMERDIEWIALHTLSDLKQYPTQLICDCSKKPALRKSKQSLIKDRIFLACYNIECITFSCEETNIVWCGHRPASVKTAFFLAVLDFV